MVNLRKARIDEIAAFVAMESAADTAMFITPYSHEKHFTEMHKARIVYLSICDAGQLVGFMILAQEPDDARVEFRRIVVANKGNGIGQAAIVEMEKYCLTILGCGRVWLDVFEFNERGRHIYEKLGYVPFEKGKLAGKPLFYYEKTL